MIMMFYRDLMKRILLLTHLNGVQLLPEVIESLSRTLRGHHLVLLFRMQIIAVDDWLLKLCLPKLSRIFY